MGAGPASSGSIGAGPIDGRRPDFLEPDGGYPGLPPGGDDRADRGRPDFLGPDPVAPQSIEAGPSGAGPSGNGGALIAGLSTSGPGSPITITIHVGEIHATLGDDERLP